jgi:hypothetical protein
MTNKQRMRCRCEFKTNKSNDNLHSITFNDLTQGEVLSLVHALQMARQISPVAMDVSSYLRNAFCVSGKTELVNEIDFAQVQQIL